MWVFTQRIQYHYAIKYYIWGVGYVLDMFYFFFYNFLGKLKIFLPFTLPYRRKVNMGKRKKIKRKRHNSVNSGHCVCIAHTLRSDQNKKIWPEPSLNFDMFKGGEY